MTYMDQLAAIAAGAASLSLGLRSMMLRKDIRTKPNAPWPVAFALMLPCAACAVASFSLWRQGGATWREVVVYAALAIAAAVLLGNLIRQKLNPNLSPA